MTKPIVQARFVATVAVAMVLGGAPSASAQSLARAGGADDFGVALDRSPVTIEAELRGFAEVPPGGTWKLLSTGAFYCDGLALDGIAFTRNAEPDVDAIVHTFDVVVDLRARSGNDDVLADLEFVVIDGDRQLPLGTFTNVPVRAGAKTSYAQTMSLNAYDLESFFGGGRTPTLRVTRSTRAL